MENTKPKTENWNSIETWERLVTSIVASGVKLDLKLIATYYGTTYNTLENRFRKIKKEAEVMKAAVDNNGAAPDVTPSKAESKTPRKLKTPKKGPLETVQKGRVTKKTPDKKIAVKAEPTDDEEDGHLGTGTYGAAYYPDAQDFDENMFT